MFNSMTSVEEKVKGTPGKAKTAAIALATNTTVAIPDGFNANQKIINNSGVDVMVLDGTASSDTATEILYEQSLKILSDSNNASVIKNGASATYELHDSYIDDDSKEQEYSYCYNLIIVRADNLFPVKVVGVMANFDSFTYDDITITAGNATTKGDYECMQDSQAFQQNLMAFPDSLLSTQFVNVCNGSMDNAGSDTDIDSTVDAFFAATDNYKNVTLNSLTAIQTYWGMFPFIWAGYAASKIYYLYTSNSTAVTYLGSLEITAPATVPASIDKSLSGFTFNFSPADDSAKKPLKFINGQFVDSFESTTIALKGIYQLKSQFTNDPSDNMIIAYMTGTVNKADVIGYNEKLQQDSNGNWSGFYSMLHPKDAAGWMALALEIGAVAMTLELFSRPLKYLWDKFRESRAKNKGEAPSSTEAEKMREAAKNRQGSDLVEAQRTMDRMGTDITIKIEFNIHNTITSVTQLQTDRTNRVTEDSRSNLTDITNRQVESVRTLSRYSMDDKIKEMGKKIGTNKAALDPAKTTEELTADLGTVKTNADSVHDNIPVEAKKLVSKTSAAEKKTMDDAHEANQKDLDTQKEIDKNNDTKDKGDRGDIELEDLPKDK